jgi:hypothetical protein
MIKLVKDIQKSNCHDCGVNPEEKHIEGCDVERCTTCKGQALSCDCDSPRETWTGIAYEKEMLYCEENNLWVKWNNGWVKCNKDDDGATHDLNTAVKIIMSNEE